MKSILMLLLLGFLSTSGCGGSRQPERPTLHQAQGSLFINGKPATGLILTLVPVSGDSGVDTAGTRPSATVGEDGHFVLTTYQEGDGAPAGEYRVGMIWPSDAESTLSRDLLGDRYVNPDATRLTLTVREGENQFDPIKLDGIRIFTVPAGKRLDKDGLE